MIKFANVERSLAGTSTNSMPGILKSGSGCSVAVIRAIGGKTGMVSLWHPLWQKIRIRNKQNRNITISTLYLMANVALGGDPVSVSQNKWFLLVQVDTIWSYVAHSDLDSLSGRNPWSRKSIPNDPRSGER